jgi:hypothetical protein
MFAYFPGAMQGTHVMTKYDQNSGIVAVERQKLYEQIWSIPAAKLAIQYGISDVGLAKACKRHKIPRPPRGYWARVEAGQKIPRTPLPEIKDPSDDMVIMRGWDLPDESVQRMVGDVKALLRTRPVDEEAVQPQVHPILEVTRALLQTSQPDLEGLVRTDPATTIDIRIAPASLDRCIDVLDLFFRAFEARGGEIKVAAKGIDDRPFTMAAIGPDGFGITMVESVDETKPVTDPQRLTGKLHLLISGDENQQQFRRRWSETKTQRLDRMINPLVDTLVNAIEVQRHRRLDAECVKRQEERVRTLRRAAAQQHDRDFYWRQQLSQDAERWRHARGIREYLDAVTAALESNQVKPRDAEAFGEWFEWAKAYVNSIDPMRQGILPSETIDGPTNTPIADLDLTHAARALMGTLGVSDTDQLWRKCDEEFRKACPQKGGALWNEITRVLEGLGYDVSKRQTAHYW